MSCVICAIVGALLAFGVLMLLILLSVMREGE